MSLVMAARRTAVTAAAVMAGVASLAPAASAAPSAASACKNGEYADYVNPATGRPFLNQGACVSHVRNGGTLKPYVEAPAPLHFVNMYATPGADGTCAVTAIFSGHQTGYLYPVTWTANGAMVGANKASTTNPDLFYLGVNGVPDNSTVTLTITGQKYTITADCVADEPPAPAVTFDIAKTDATHYTGTMTGLEPGETVTVSTFMEGSGQPVGGELVPTADETGTVVFGGGFSSFIPCYEYPASFTAVLANGTSVPADETFTPDHCVR